MTKIQKRIKGIRNILSREQTEILETALFSMLPVFLTKVSGQFFNLIAASYFGTKSDSWSKFLIASTIPDLISNVLIAGLLGSIVIPTLVTAKRREGETYFIKLYSTLINITLIAFAVISIVVMLLGEFLLPLAIKIFSPEVELTPKEVSSVVNMMRFLLIPQAILAVSVFISSGLNLYNRYLIPQTAPLFYNIGRIFSLVILVPLLDYSPWGIVMGVYIGAALHLGIQLPLAYEVGLRFKFYIDLSSKYIKQIFKVSIPRTFALASEYIGLAINNFIAYSITGGIAALNFANSISLIVPQLFAFTFAYASFTKISEHFEEGDNKAVESIIIKTFNEMIFLAMPFIVTFLVLRVPVTRLTFGLLPGNLALQDTYQIAWVLLWFSVGHVFVIGKWFMYKVYYAAKDTLTAFIVSFVGLVLTVTFSILFTNLFSHNPEFSISSTQLTIENFLTREDGVAAVGGIALGMSIAYSIEFILLFAIFNKKFFRLNLRLMFDTLMRKFIAAGAMTVLIYFMYKIWDVLSYAVPTSAERKYLGSTTLNLLILTVITIATSFLFYYLVCLLLKVEELKILKKYLNPIFKVGGLRIK